MHLVDSVTTLAICGGAVPGLLLPTLGTGTGGERILSEGQPVGKPARRFTSTSSVNTVVIGSAVGIAASWVKALSEPRLQALFERLVRPTAGEKELVGADISGHPERMPPAEVADRLARRVCGHGLSQQQRVSVLNPVHYTFGVALGMAYVEAARRWPTVACDLGVPAGLAIYGSTHASALPILRIQEPPWKLPVSAVLWEGTSHVVFGLALEGFRRAFLGLAGAAAGS
jgi:putative membrane protein